MIEAEGGVFLAQLDRMDLGRGLVLPDIDDVARAIAVAQFLVAAGDSDAPLTIAEIAVTDVARSFLALIEDPMDGTLWDRLEACRGWFATDDDGDA
jgi:hypothetical protein